MYQLFIQLFNMSMTAGWLILAVLIVRFLTKRMPKTWHCFLWYLVMLRLLLPVSIESEWSLIPNSKVITEELLFSKDPLHEIESINLTEQMLVSDGQGLTDEEKQEKYAAYFKQVQEEDLAQLEKEDMAQSEADTKNVLDFLWPEFVEFITPNSGDSVNPLQVIVYGASYIWMLGIGVMILYTCISYLRVSGRVRQAVLLKENVYQSEYVDSPFVFGLIKPRIYIPFYLQGDALDCVIAHERTHIKRLDHVVRLFAFLLLIVYWFHPLVWIFYLLLCRDMELACDEMVIKQIGMDKKKLYSQTLLECSVSAKKFAVCPLAFGETSVKQRVKNILNFQKPTVWLVAGTVVLCVVLVVCFMTNPVNDGYGMGSIQTNNEYETPVNDNEIINGQIQEQLYQQTMIQTENMEEPKNLQEPPALYLTDLLSSFYTEFSVQPGTYEWNYYQTEESMCGISACGLHPVEAARHAEVLKIPHYNGAEEVLYSFHYSVIPDRMEIEEYGIEDMGNTDAKPTEEYSVEGKRLVSLKRNRIYAIRAVWEESKLEERGFYGNAYYTVVTGEAAPKEDSTLSEDFTMTQGEPQTPQIDYSENELFTEEVNTLDGVTMELAKYNSMEGEVKIYNECGKEIQYGDWYEIQVYQDGNWYSMSLIIDNVGYHDIAYPVQNQSASIWEINWSYFYGELPKGKYRIVKDILDIGDFTKYYITTEFEIGYEHYVVG